MAIAKGGSWYIVIAKGGRCMVIVKGGRFMVIVKGGRFMGCQKNEKIQNKCHNCLKYEKVLKIF
jgi:hypothetical protein